MTGAKSHRRKFICYTAVVATMFLILEIPAVQYAVADALIEFLRIAERTLYLPCAALDHGHCFSFDKFDPTCPQCM